MYYQRLNYQTCEPSILMDFVFMEVGGEYGWRIYIINNIDYGHMDTDGHSTHRNHFNGDTYKSICWRGRINTLDDAKAIAALWADTTAIYASQGRRGRSFDQIAAQLIKE